MLIHMHSGQKIRHMLILVTAAVCQCTDAVGADFASHCFLVIVRNRSGGLFRALLIPTAHSDNLMTSQCIKCIVENYVELRDAFFSLAHARFWPAPLKKKKKKRYIVTLLLAVFTFLSQKSPQVHY